MKVLSTWKFSPIIKLANVEEWGSLKLAPAATELLKMYAYLPTLSTKLKVQSVQDRGTYRT